METSLCQWRWLSPVETQLPREKGGWGGPRFSPMAQGVHQPGRLCVVCRK